MEGEFGTWSVLNALKRRWGVKVGRFTWAGTMGALTAVAASSPFKAPTTASAISIATPSWQKEKYEERERDHANAKMG